MVARRNNENASGKVHPRYLLGIDKLDGLVNIVDGYDGQNGTE